MALVPEAVPKKLEPMVYGAHNMQISVNDELYHTFASQLPRSVVNIYLNCDTASVNR